jgi:hypothetical protein
MQKLNPSDPLVLKNDMENVIKMTWQPIYWVIGLVLSTRFAEYRR